MPPSLLEEVTANWFEDERNYDGRWTVIDTLAPNADAILDMAAGCGTFLLHGLNCGANVFGVEPDPWKRNYFVQKIRDSGYSEQFQSRLIGASGEHLPFCNESFDLVTTYQTLEHVSNVSRCVEEMVRVLRPGGILYLRAPNYMSFFEPHYQLPFLPVMHKGLAAAYLRLLGRPTAGLAGLRWTTKSRILRALARTGLIAGVTPTHRTQTLRALAEKRVLDRLPPPVRSTGLASGLLSLRNGLRSVRALTKLGRAERNIDLWATKT
jgi:ubiquinone/menaquinone biosynthesis C-methylase UbiE